MDHTIEFGTKKCLVVLGITLKQFRRNKCKIRHKDMKVLCISIVENANASSVTEILNRIAKITGFPIQILSDNGSNIKKGVADFIKAVSCGFVVR